MRKLETHSKVVGGVVRAHARNLKGDRSGRIRPDQKVESDANLRAKGWLRDYEDDQLIDTNTQRYVGAPVVAEIQHDRVVWRRIIETKTIDAGAVTIDAAPAGNVTISGQ